MGARGIAQSFVAILCLLILLTVWLLPTPARVSANLVGETPTPTSTRQWAPATPPPTLILDCLQFEDGDYYDDLFSYRCSRFTLEPTVQPTTVAVAVVKPKPGINPETAVEPNGTWEFISPNATHWYRMNDAGLELRIWLDANGQRGLSLAIYGPDQRDLYGKPVGRGAFNKFEPSHDLYWTGFTTARGTWYALVTNNGQATIPYSLNYRRVINSVAGRCSACHGFEIEWDRCVSHGNDFCGDLQKEYTQH